MKTSIMKRAWEIARAAATIFGGNAIDYIRGGAVKLAWAEAEHKPATKEDKIKALEGMGFKRWQKGTMDRLYINAGALGLVCEHRHTGSISNALFNGNQISNGEAYRMRAAKTFLDVKTWILYSGNDSLKEAAEKLVAKVG